MNIEKRKYKKADNIVARKIDDNYVLVPIRNNIQDMDSIYAMNEVAAFVWERLDGNTPLSNILNELIDTFHVDYQTAQTDVMDIIDDMEKYVIIASN